jgi:hypothetical protein
LWRLDRLLAIASVLDRRLSDASPVTHRGFEDVRYRAVGVTT